MRLELDSPVRCADGPFGRLADVVIDPISRRVTHVVVEPRHDHARARLVPIGWLSDEPDGLALDRTTAEIEELEPVQESEYLRLGQQPALDPEHDIGVQTFLALPLYQEMDGIGTLSDPDPHTTVIYDRVPRGEVEIRRTSAVLSSDGHFLGKVDGFLVGSEGPFADVVLERGHLWGRREVVVPYRAVERVETDAVHLSLTKDEVGALPARRIHRWF
jgi:sporulation protein YlmC with PRC-barrel domain